MCVGDVRARACVRDVHVCVEDVRAGMRSCLWRGVGTYVAVRLVGSDVRAVCGRVRGCGCRIRPRVCVF